MLCMKIVSFYCYTASHYDFFAVSIVLGNIVIPVLVLNYVRIRYGKVSSSGKTRGGGALGVWPLIQQIRLVWWLRTTGPQQIIDTNSGQ